MLDVLVAGAGTAGAAVAWQCALRGLSVRCVEAKPMHEAGARWMNGVSEAALLDLGISRPQPPFAHPGPTMHMVAGWGPERVSVDDTGLIDVDMRWLVRTLHERANKAGAALSRGRVTAIEQHDDHVAAQISGQAVHARWLVDAAGLRGPTATTAPRTELCVASQHEHELADAEQACAWLEAHELKPGEVASHTGVAGGYSIVNVCVNLPHDGESGGVSLLTGSMPGLGHTAGTRLMQGFVEKNPWIGPLRFGGARAIPVGPPHVRIDDGRVARVGDSAGQVYAMHGSGIVPGMQAARLLAQTLADGGTPWDYNVAWQRAYGPSMASSSVFQTFSRSLSPSQMRDLIRAGLMHPALVRAGLRQQEPDLRPRVLLALVGGMVRVPRAAARLAPVVARMRKAEALWRAYPDDPAELDDWVSRRDVLLG